MGEEDLSYEKSVERRALILTSLAHFVNDGVSIVPVSIFPLLLATFGITAPELGVVATMWNITTVLGSPVIGHLSDRLKQNGALLVAGIVIMAVGIVGMGWSVATGMVRSWLPLGLYPALVLFAAIGGFGSTVAHPIGGTLLSQVYPPSKIGKALGLNGSMGSMGRTLYPSCVVILITALGLPCGVITLGLLGLLPAALIEAFPLRIARDRALRAARSPALDSPDQYNGKKTSPQKITSLSRSAKRSMAVLMTVGIVRGIFTQGVMSFISVFLVHVQQYSFSYGVGVIMTVSLLLGVPSQFLLGHFSDMHRRGALVVSNVGPSLAIILYLHTLSNQIVSTAFLAMFMFFIYSFYPILISAVTDAVPARLLSLSSSIVWGVGLLGGSAIGPILVGSAVASSLSLLPTIFFALAVASGLATTLVALMPRRPRQPAPDLR